jgi:hypothetical protein
MNQKILFQEETNTRQEKIKYLFDRECENRPNKMHTHNVNFEGQEHVMKSERFYYPRVLLEKYKSNTFVRYNLFDTGSELYSPLSMNHIELCLKYGLDAYSRTLRIYNKKKALKRILKSKNPPENWEELKEILEVKIEQIYSGGNTINLNLIK